jgi:hypothetical protein
VGSLEWGATGVGGVTPSLTAPTMESVFRQGNYGEYGGSGRNDGPDGTSERVSSGRVEPATWVQLGGCMRGMVSTFALGALLGSTEVSAMVQHSGIVYEKNPPATMLDVDNCAEEDALIYAARGLQTIRLGHVSGMTRQQLRIPKDVLFSGGTNIRFVVHRIGLRGSSATEEMTVFPGDSVSLAIAG